MGKARVKVDAGAAKGRKAAPKDVNRKIKVEVQMMQSGSEYLYDLGTSYLKDAAVKDDGSDDANTGENGAGVNSSRDMVVGGKTEVDQDCCTNMTCGKSMTDRCKRKIRGVECVHRYCFQCCIETPVTPGLSYSYCSGHYAQKMKKEHDDRYVEEGLNRKLLNRSKFYSYEERFTDTQQTVTIWCNRDFYGIKKFSSDVMIDVVSAERRNEAMRKRKLAMLARSVPAPTSTSPKKSPTKASAAASSSSSSSSSSSPDKKQPPAQSTINDTGENKVESYIAKAWCLVRAQRKQENEERWKQVQNNWLDKQTKAGVKSTTWIKKD